VTGLERIRRRVPFVVFVLLLVIAVLVVGFACACLSGSPLQAADRAAAPLGVTAAVIVMWSLIASAIPLVALVQGSRLQATGRASPVVTQRLLF
jgi:hypothetical protein